MLFVTGSGIADGATGSVEVFTDGAWASPPASCTDMGATCNYLVCAANLRIKVGCCDGWIGTTSVNGQVLHNGFLKNNEVAYSFPPLGFQGMRP